MADKSPHEVYPLLQNKRNRLDQYFNEFIQAGKLAIEALGGNIFLTDFLIIGVIKRSIDIIDGFAMLMDKWNLVVAAPLIRLQLDTLLRLSYLATLKDADAVSFKISEGVNFSDLKDSSGKKLTDARLRDYARPQFPWIDDIYKTVSKYVHFSNRHIFFPIHNLQNEKRIVNFCITKGSRNVKQSDIASYYHTMIEITNAILLYIVSWGEHKKGFNPKTQ